MRSARGNDAGLEGQGVRAVPRGAHHPSHFRALTARLSSPSVSKEAQWAKEAQSEAPDRAQESCPSHAGMTPYVAPMGLVSRRSPWIAPGLLLAFVATVAGIQAVLSRLTVPYRHLISILAGLQSIAMPKHGNIAVRAFVVAALVLFAAFAAGSVRARLRLATIALAIYIPLMVAIDLVFARWSQHGGIAPFSARGNLCDGLAGIVAACFAIFLSAKLPANFRVAQVVKRPKYFVVVLVSATAASIGSIIVIFDFGGREQRWLASFPLLGGLASVFVCFFVLLPVYLCLVGYVIERVRRQSAREQPSTAMSEGNEDQEPFDMTFGFLVPAHNEESGIADCLRAIDAAVGAWGRSATLYVIENGSTDATREVAQATLEECQYVRGVLLTSSTEIKSRAKAHALNTGLSSATESVLVRVDADTLVTKDLLQRMAPHFLAPHVGGVGTAPLPDKMTTWIERMRAVEVYYGAVFKRTSQGAVDAISVLPGAAVAFRRDLLLQVGGFSEGMFGEDADITVRVGRLGYRIVSDPNIKVFSEQPRNLRELREQRMRWSCGLIHMIGRNRSAMSGRQGLRGVWTLPWACFVMFRKILLIPFAAAAVGLIALDHSLLPLREVGAAGAILLGLQLVAMAAVLAVVGGGSLIYFLPSYLVFRVIVSYFALEMLLTVQLKGTPPLPPPLPARSEAFRPDPLLQTASVRVE